MYSSLFKLSFLGCPGKTEKISSLTLFRNSSKAGEPFGGFHVDLSLHVETWEGIYWLSFLKYDLHLIFLAKSSKSLCKSGSLINYGVYIYAHYGTGKGWDKTQLLYATLSFIR